MLKLEYSDDSPTTYLNIALTNQALKPIIRGKCTKHGYTTFVLGEEHAKLCTDAGQKISGLQVVMYECVKCKAERSNRSSGQIIREAHTREIKRVFGNRCINCGYDEYPEILEFHHVYPEHKEANIGNKKSFETKFEEAKKCVLLCPTCHSLADKNLLPNIVSLFEQQYLTVLHNLGDEDALTDMQATLMKLKKEDENS